MRTFAAEIKGLTPLLPNRYIEEAETIEAIGAKPRDKSREDDWRKREALLRFHENGHGPFMPGRNIRSAMIAGADATGMKHKMGRTQSKLGPFLRRGILVEPLEILYPKNMVKKLTLAREATRAGKVAEPLTIFPLHRDVVRIPPVTGALVVKYWPMLEDWGFDFTITVFDDSLESENELRASLDAAGVFCGLGTGRPDFGKFRVEKWQEVV
jgi:hypothetical protein